MFTNNPFAALADVLPANAMQVYIVLMVLAVFLGTLFDVYHKGSARYFFASWRNSRDKASRQLGGGELADGKNPAPEGDAGVRAYLAGAAGGLAGAPGLAAPPLAGSAG